MLDDVQCTGRENKLLACSSARILHVSRNCKHSEDAGVRCEGMYAVKPPNKGHFGDGPVVPCREVVLFSEVFF